MRFAERNNLLIRELKEENEQLKISLEQSKQANKRIKEETRYIDYNRLLARFNRQKDKLEQYEKALKSVYEIVGYEDDEKMINVLLDTVSKALRD